MSGERWIVRDTKCGNSQPFLGTRGWGFTVAAAGSYERREDADNALGSLAGWAPGRLVVRRVVPAGTKRARAAARNDKATHWGPAGAKECCMVGLSDARVASCRSDVTCKNCLRHLDATDAAAQADADNVATMRAELEGLRATDAEMAAKLAQAQVEVAAAERRASDAEARCAGFDRTYDLVRSREQAVRVHLKALWGETTDEAAKRVVAERDALRRELDEVRAGVARVLDRGKAPAVSPYS